MVKKTKSLSLNFGPQHPAAHGVLRLILELEKNNINTNKVSANFLLLNFDKCKISAIKFKKKLEEKGIIVRSLEVYGMKNKLRVTIGNSKENNFFLKTLKSIF